MNLLWNRKIELFSGYKMMQAGILDHLLSRMNYRDEGGLQVASSNEQLISEGDTQPSNVALTSHIAWYLMKSILHEQTSKKHACGFEKLNVPSIDAMRYFSINYRALSISQTVRMFGIRFLKKIFRI